MVSQRIAQISILCASQIFNFFVITAILRLGRFRFFSLKHQNRFIVLGESLLLYAGLAFTSLRVKAKRLGSKLGLTKDRWHTLFPKTVVSIMLSVLMSYGFVCYGAYIISGKLAVIVVTLCYNFVYQMFKLIPKFDRKM